MNRQQATSVAFACVLVFGGLAPAPVWAQGAPAIERNPGSAGASAVAVLPFENISGQPQDDWLGAGIAETVLADLETRNVAVIGPEVLLAEARRDGTDLEVERNALALSRRLGAAWLVTGGYQHIGDLLRITARVVDVRTGAVTSTVKVDGRLADLFKLQDRIVAELNLGAPLAPSTGGVTGGQGAAAVVDPTAAGQRAQAAGERMRPAVTEAPAASAPPAAGSPGPGRLPTEAGGAPAPRGGDHEGLAGAELNAGPFAFSGPPAPVPPSVISRDASGRATVRAVQLTTPLRIDGALDEPIYKTVPSISDFIQSDPQEGAPATEKTEVWIFFDRNTLYVSARCWESHPERMVLTEMRRDNTAMVQNEILGIAFDTFYDRRNAVSFDVTALGGRIDAQIGNDGRQINVDWNTVWDVKVDRFEGGWSFEIAIPFKSLRYRPGHAQIWGFNARRHNRWKNEISFVTRVPASVGPIGYSKSSLMATLVGLEAPAGSRNLEIKPYAISQLTTDKTATPRVSNDLDGDWGVDAKYGISQNATVDVTYNTDFAQVEADEQQINLTRFSLFFPEKRDFFLENQGTFQFGGTTGPGGGGGGGGGPGGGALASPNDTPLLFYSRRVGLNQGFAVPIDAGGRLTGRSGRYSFGFLHIQTDDEPLTHTRSTDFSVARVRRDILRKSSVGAMFTRRSIGQSGIGSNDAYGLDGTFGFYNNLYVNTYWARTRTDGLATADATSYRGQLDYVGDRYGVQLERLVVGRHFNPELGFLRRGDMRRSFSQFRFSPRLRGSTRIRKFFWMGSAAYIEDGAGRVETRDWDGEFAVEFHNQDRFFVGYSATYEFLPQAFAVAPRLTLPVQGYDFASARIGFNLGPGRRISGNFSVDHGTFYSGEKTTFTWARGRINLRPQLSLEPRAAIDWIDLPEGTFTSRLIGSRVTYTVTPMMFVSALLQYNSTSNTVAANVRLRWEYRPGSELFIVWNEQRDTLARRFPDLALVNRAFVVKINRLFRF